MDTHNPHDIDILFIDDDRVLSNVISGYLCALGYRVSCAADGQSAWELFISHKPQLIIADLYMPFIDGLRFLEKIREHDAITPVIVTTDNPQLESAIQAIQHGAHDYLQKPFELELLHSKIQHAIKSTRQRRQNAVLSELNALYQVTKNLTEAQDLNQVLQETFRYCLEVSTADGGSIQICDARSMVLVPLRRKEPLQGSGDGYFQTERCIARWAVANDHSVVLADGITTPVTEIPTELLCAGSALAIPLRVGTKIIGVVTLYRSALNDPFTLTDMNILEVLVSQAGIAINNAQLYATVNQKLEELTLIGSYSERLRGLMEEQQVIDCLFQTVPQYFSIDVMGFLVNRKRGMQFLYWSRGKLSKEDRERICGDAQQQLSQPAEAALEAKKIKSVPIGPAIVAKHELHYPFQFSLAIPICWDDFEYGVVYFGSQSELENREEKRSLLNSLVNQTRIALNNAKLYGDMKENYIRTIKALAIAVDAKDTYTHGHSENVMNLAEQIAVEMQMDAKFIGVIRDAGLLHDIGKIGIPGTILNKAGPLTCDEFNGIMKTHSALGANIVRDVPFLQELYSLILHHHERFDGDGYPDGLKGEAIPLGARILHVADAFEAMTSNRPYRKSLGLEEALRRIQLGKGEQFDPFVVDMLLKVALRKGWLADAAVEC